MAKKAPKIAPSSAMSEYPGYHPPSDVRTLQEAEEIKSDKKRHGAAISHAKTQAATLTKLVGNKGSIQQAGKAKPQGKGSLGKGRTK